MVAKILRMQLREQSIPRLGRRSKAYYGARVERELLAAFDSCPERNFIALNDQNEVWGLDVLSFETAKGTRTHCGVLEIRHPSFFKRVEAYFKQPKTAQNL